ncbi:zonular occludens toxin domain-containing protein [Vibrio ostreicida]|uniref:zonular occludens toxin domain-containing protein n=1 Tax=Vibrio ostreicida TaxID=526588 RepID=UPI000970FA79|nr:zonular occludens toxin domain-containing protein [Vibrio ostreicida]
MAVYFVTGKLGAGKSLTSVGRIRDAFFRGVPVATNLNINLRWMLGRNKRHTRLLRVPDKPSIADLEAIGKGNTSYDESKNGLLVLDECGTWFNSRTWNDKSRHAVIDWMLHARKLGWDILFIVQDISIVDKQARLALAEHTVFCRRLDRMQVPVVSTLIRVLSLGQLTLRLPKLHIGIVKYGDNAQSLTVDKWHLWGTDLYATYDTKQAFSNHYEHGVYSVLPPWYTHGRYTVPYTLRNCMRITKIYGRQYSRIALFSLGVVSSFLFTQLVTPSASSDVDGPSHSSTPVPALDLSGFTIASYMRAPNQPLYFEIDNSGTRLTSVELASLGYTFDAVSRCHINLIQGGTHEAIFC